ncbi:MAG TPA: nucleoside-diphosphate kinase [Kiritimatiellae bacterium]|nr:nucleoside-diphosphate kinase [Kiritimatiellia bacterium]
MRILSNMRAELAYVLINPYTISKSRTGGVLGRIIAWTQLDLVGARMFGPGKELVEAYAQLVEADPGLRPDEAVNLSRYVRRAYAPASDGRRRRVMMLVFAGEGAVEKIRRVAGSVRHNTESARTVRDIYGDFIVDDKGEVVYIEPAIMVGESPEAAEKGLKLWAAFSESDGGMIENTVDLPRGQPPEKTLVLIKPDNFREPSVRPGSIIDIFSGSGLRIICAKVHRMSVAEAMQFYAPVRDVLEKRLRDGVKQRAAVCLQQEFGLRVAGDVAQRISEVLTPVYAEWQFNQIVHFMTGVWPADCAAERRREPGKERCLALVYAGKSAVNVIRDILGPTDPKSARPGSVRRQFGRDVMVNAAHASDSPARAQQEMEIIRVAEDTIRSLVERAYGPVV